MEMVVVDDQSTDNLDVVQAAMNVPTNKYMGKLKLLLVEDNSIDQRLISMLLKRSDEMEFEVTAASSCDEAFEKFQQQTFDLAILDFWLGSETAVSLIRKMSLSGSTDLPIILLSGTETDTVSEIGKECGLHFISKFALNTESLLSTIKLVLEESEN